MACIAVVCCLPAAFRGNRAFLGCGQIDTGAPSLRQSDRNRLFCGTCSVFALANMLDFLVHKLTGLRARSLAFAFVAAGSFDRFLLWHVTSPSLLGGVALALPSLSSSVDQDAVTSSSSR
jgi:hypothetical protein